MIISLFHNPLFMVCLFKILFWFYFCQGKGVMHLCAICFKLKIILSQVELKLYTSILYIDITMTIKYLKIYLIFTYV